MKTIDNAKIAANAMEDKQRQQIWADIYHQKENRAFSRMKTAGNISGHQNMG